MKCRNKYNEPVVIKFRILGILRKGFLLKRRFQIFVIVHTFISVLVKTAIYIWKISSYAAKVFCLYCMILFSTSEKMDETYNALGNLEVIMWAWKLGGYIYIYTYTVYIYTHTYTYILYTPVIKCLLISMTLVPRTYYHFLILFNLVL